MKLLHDPQADEGRNIFWGLSSDRWSLQLISFNSGQILTGMIDLKAKTFCAAFDEARDPNVLFLFGAQLKLFKRTFLPNHSSLAKSHFVSIKLIVLVSFLTPNLSGRPQRKKDTIPVTMSLDHKRKSNWVLSSNNWAKAGTETLRWKDNKSKIRRYNFDK